ncbi:MAG: amidohydrolase family protein [Acidobacteriota bacterium]|nr:amidohydrolase family protein [Acidobacteriota bacterium]
MPALLLQGARVIDPTGPVDEVADVLIDDGLIRQVGPSLTPPPGGECVDLRGTMVVPALVDLHAHVMAGLGDFCVEADSIGVDVGVPVVVDGGTSGVSTFNICRRAVIDHPLVRTRVLAFMDPNRIYLATGDFICHKLEIANDLRNLDVEALAAAVERNADVVVGFKVRACHVGNPLHSPFLAAALEVAGGRPVMVHLGRFPHTPTITPAALLDALRPGDIITHAFRGAGGLLGPDGRPTPQLREAVARGVLLDMGHSATDFRFSEARRLMDHGYRPFTASTDLNVFNVGGPVFSYLENLTKLLALGCPLAEVVEVATTNPARAIGWDGRLGSVAPGCPAELSVISLSEEGPVPVSDGVETLMAPAAVVPVGCVRDGVWIPARRPASFARAGRTWGVGSGGPAG